MVKNRLRARDLSFQSEQGLGLDLGILPPSPLNAITDLAGVRVGHVTLIEGDDIRTGVTAILPHRGDLYHDKVPAGLAVGNGYGKLAGATQLTELGEIETPVLLTNTLAIPCAAEALIEWTLAQPGNELVRSVNPIVGETNDGKLNNIRARSLTVEHMLEAIRTARGGPVAEGCVGAGTGTVCFGWKGGIGSSSRVLPESQGGYAVGALVQSNFGGHLQISAYPTGMISHLLRPDQPNQGEAADLKDKIHPSGATHPRHPEEGSIMIVLATDAPLSDRNLTRLARRGLAGLARTGADMSNGSGDYAIAFSTHQGVRRTPERRKQARPEPGRRVWAYPEVPNDLMSPLFLAAIECTQEAIYNSLTMATTMSGNGVTVEALPLDKLKAILEKN